jgi:NADH dehydrogenase
MADRPKVVIIGGGFGGLSTAKALGKTGCDVILIDRKNHHTFQPLLYQVATAVLSPGEIASPIRRILYKYENIEVVMGEVEGIERDTKTIRLETGIRIPYDYLVVAAGARHSYFGNDAWETSAPGLKTVEDALEMRRRILLAFEFAERQAYLTGRHEPITFVVVGAGPTGVELAGAIADITRKVLAADFELIDTTKARVLLFEGSDRVLGTFDASLSESAKEQLEDIGVEIHLNSFVTEIDNGRVKVGDDWYECDVVLWATGVAASPLGKTLGVETDKAGRIFVEPDLTIQGDPNVFVIGDMASIKRPDGTPVPGVSPAAMQMGKQTAKNILNDLKNRPRKDFVYTDKGSMATIGKSKAIADLRGWRFRGVIAWMLWLVVHIMFLIGFRNRISVLGSWLWAYLTRGRSALLITGDAEDLINAITFMEGDEGARVIKRISDRNRKRSRSAKKSAG